MNKTIIISLSTLLFVTSANVASAKIYKWTDANGSVHYSATPPKEKKVKAKNIEDKIRYAAGKPKYPSAERSETKTEKNEISGEKLAGPSKKLVKYCKQQRTNLKQLKENFNTKWIDTDGKETKLTQKQRKDKVKEIKKSITSSCVGV